MVAEWVTGEIWTHRGKRLCGSMYGRVIYQTNLVFEFERGQLKALKEMDNSDHPAVPKKFEGVTPVCVQIPASADPHLR